LKNLLQRILPKSVRSYFRKRFKIRPITISQAGQDFWVYGEAFNEKENGYFVDIGAFDGIYHSNTYFLEYEYDWDGLCIEANPLYFQDLIKNRDVICLNTCLDRSEEEVDFVQNTVMSGIIDKGLDNSDIEQIDEEIITLKTYTLMNLLKEHDAPAIIDYLSIDVEGAEERILSNFDFNAYKFKCITIERPSNKLRSILDQCDYHLIKEIPGLDCFYVHNDFLEQYKLNLFQFYNKRYYRLPQSRFLK